MRAIPTIALAAALLSAGPSAAQSREIGLDRLPAGVALRAVLACAPDAERLCANVAPGGGRVAACLAEQRHALSGACAEEVAKAGLLRRAVAACAPDIARFCAAVPPGGGRILACLVGAQDQLAAACHDGLGEAVEAYGG